MTETRAYLEDMARKNIARYTRAARDCLHWAKVDRENGDRESALWYLISAHRHRRTAAEWFDRSRRIMARRFRDTETGEILTEADLLEAYQSDPVLCEEYPTAGAYISACQTYRGGTLEEIR